MRLLILGSSGMLGNTLVRYLISKKNLNVAFTLRNHSQISIFSEIFKSNLYYIFDANKMENFESIVADFKPDLCINCIGIINKKIDQKNNIQNIKINSLLPHYLSSTCLNYNSRFLHISTDCVFSGKMGNYTENINPDPVDLYGRSKLLGEVINNNSTTIRTSIIGHEFSSKNGLLEWVLNSKKDVNGYKNAIFSGLTTLEFSKIIYKYFILNNNLKGLFHVTSHHISKNDLLLLIKDIYKLKINIIPEFNTKINRSLSSEKFKNITGYNPPGWFTLLKELKKFR